MKILGLTSQNGSSSTIHSTYYPSSLFILF